MATPRQSGRVGVQVVCVAAGHDFVREMLLPVGQSIGWCVNASGVVGVFADAKTAKVGVWGKVVKPDTVVLEGDRIEVYLPCLPEATIKARKMKADGIVRATISGDNSA